MFLFARIAARLLPTLVALLLATALAAAASAADPHKYPRTFMINSWRAPGDLWKYDWIVSFPQYDPGPYHQANPTGIAQTYVRREPDGVPSAGYWNESSINLTYQQVSPGRLWSNEGWGGGTDTISDGRAANIGYMRPWDLYWDTLHNADGSAAVSPGCASGTVCHAWNLARPQSAQLLAQLTVYAAKIDHLYGKGWDGIWSDNVIGPTIGASWYIPNHDADRNGVVDPLASFRQQWCNGLALALKYLRDSLPGKYVGGNGAGAYWNSAASGYGWKGDDPDAWWKYANTSLVEGMNQFQGHTDAFVSWLNQWVRRRDPYGQPRLSAFFDAGGSSGLARMRWGLTLSLMASTYYAAPDEGWYDEYWGGALNKRGYLGQPTSPPVKLGNGIWRRDFTNGIALNNSTASAQTVSLGGSFRHLQGSQAPSVNDGSLVTSVTIPAQDGLILLRTTG
jgi:hypothetical protein